MEKFDIKVLLDLIVWSYLVCVIAFGYIFKSPVTIMLTGIFRTKVLMVYSVLFIAAAITVPFMFFGEYSWEQLLVTYAIATSMHEVILKNIGNFILKYTGISKEELL